MHADTNRLIPRTGLKWAWIALFWAIWSVCTFIPQVVGYALDLRWGIAVAIGGLGAVKYLIRPVYIPPLHLPAALLVAAAAGSYIYSYIPDYTLLRAGALALLFGASIFGLSACLRTPEDLQRLFLVFTFIYAVGIIVVVVAGASASIAISDASYRFQGNSELKATGAGHMIIASFPFLAWWLRYGGRGMRPVLFLLGAFTAYLLVATKARTGLGTAFIVGPLTLTAIRGGKLGTAFIASVCCLVVGGALIEFSQSARTTLRLDSEDVSTGRFERWESLFRESAESPVIGHGFGLSRYRYLNPHGGRKTYSSTELKTIERSRGRRARVVSHNEHLGLMFDLGLIGIICFWSLLAATIQASIRLFNLPRSPWRDMVIAIAISCGADVFNTFSHDPYLTIGNVGAFWFWAKVACVILADRMLRGTAVRRVSRA